MLRMELSGKRKRGRPQRMRMHAVREDMAMIEVAKEDVEDRNQIMEMENHLWRPLTGRSANLRSELHARA